MLQGGAQEALLPTLLGLVLPNIVFVRQGLA